MTVNYSALLTEISTDPKGYGYATPYNAGDDVTVASLLDQVRTTEQIPQSSLQFSQVFNAVVPTEYATVMTNVNSTLKQMYFQTLGVAGRIDLTNTNVKNALDLIFTSSLAPVSFSNIHALYTRNGSRAETLFGAGTVLSYTDVDIARQL